jgi:2'-5' RNA ligase
MGNTIRLFIAIELPMLVKDALLETASQLGNELPNQAVRWVRPEQMHLTLRFLGDTAVAQLQPLQARLAQLGQLHAPFQLRLNGVGAFPNRKRPRVIWAGLAGGLARLQTMQANVEAQVVALGWASEKRPFNPHLTLGRVKAFGEVRNLNWKVPLAEIGFGVTAVQLIESELRPSGAVYKVLQTVNLNPSAYE